MPDLSEITIAQPDHQFPVVGIGASAGGLEAFKLFTRSIPEKSGMAYVYVQHLSPVHDSFLPEIIQKLTKLPVQLVADNVNLQPEHIYIIPPGLMLTASDGVLKTEPIKNKNAKTIDLFFSSLGVVHQSFAVGVVLSGSLNDGTLGLQVIKSYGGITFAQEEATAAFDSMPRSAIQSGAVDFVLPAEQIVPKLIEINHPFHANYSEKEIKQRTPEEDQEVFRQLLTVLRIRRGVDFTNYKQSTVKRRIIRRLALNKIAKVHDYLTFLRENKSEQDALYNDMLISVTNFFRDPKSFDLLCSSILPRLLGEKTVNEPLRIWVAGCATGEEAYSIAICLHEYLGDKLFARKIQIFATDVSEIAIAKARTGVYRQTELTGLSAQQIQQFFTKQDGSYQINKSIRELCVFAHHNLLKDPPFSRIDLVSCRNVMIYLEPVLQRRALSTFHYSLNDKGYLMLGKSETVGAGSDLFNTYNQHEKIYLSKGTRAKTRHLTTTSNEQTLKDIDQDIQDKGSDKDINKLADAALLAKYAPAGVLVNQAYDIIQFRGKTDAWLSPPPGKPSFNVLKMARDGLSFEIRNLLHLAHNKGSAIRKEGIFFKDEGDPQYVNIEVIPLTDVAESYYLVVFQRSLLSSGSTLSENEAGSPHPQENINAWLQRIEQLEKELGQTREDMRSITEVQEAANEELQSANEELLSGSEELQSLNEELETSKEELQSTNEEITIVNTELLDRNDQLNSSRRYAEEIFKTIHDPLVVLDPALRVLRASEGFFKMFGLREEDVEGNYLYELGKQQWNIPALRDYLEKVLPERGSFKSFELHHIFEAIGPRTMEVTARQFDTYTGEKLILLAIADITDKRKVEEGLARAEVLLAESMDRLYFAVEAAGIGAWDFDPVTGELTWDNNCRRLFGLEQDDTVNYDVFLNALHPDDRTRIDEETQRALSGSGNGEFNEEYRAIGKNDKVVRWIKARGRAYFNPANQATRLTGAVLDISAEKLTEEKQLDLLRKKDEFISIASHELKTPITALNASLQLLSKYKNDPAPANLPRLIDQANKSMEKVSRLVDDLLNVNSLKEGQLQLRKVRFNMAEMLQRSANQLYQGTHELVVSGGENLWVNADEGRIEQVIINFINNAVKYAPDANTIRLFIEKENEMVKVAVKDNGPGIAGDKLPHLFERYFRVEHNERQYSGLGLGLYISSEIIKRHGGQIGVDSEIGEGSTFWFTLPL